MPIPSAISDLSKVASECSPQGTETAKGTIDDYFRAYGSFIRILSDLVGGPTVVLASAATVNIGFAGSANVSITGTTAITAFDTIAEGTLRWVTFAGALTLTHDAAKLQLPGAANITTTAGDVAVFKSLGAGNWRCLGYQRVSGTGPQPASGSRDGYLSSTDWTAFNSKLSTAAAAAAYLALSGGTLSGKLTIANGSADDPVTALVNTSTLGPTILFGSATSNKYLRLRGSTIEWVNSAFTSVISSLSDSGVLSAVVVTETSDERKKKCWKRLPADLIERLAGIKKAGTFRWKEGNAAAVGIGAQSLEAIIPEAIYTDDKGGKQVNTGGAAMAIIPELCRELVAMRVRLAKLEAK